VTPCHVHRLFCTKGLFPESPTREEEMDDRRLLLTELSLDASPAVMRSADDMVEAISPFQLPSTPSVAGGVRPSGLGAFCALSRSFHGGLRFSGLFTGLFSTSLTASCVLVAAAF